MKDNIITVLLLIIIFMLSVNAMFYKDRVSSLGVKEDFNQVIIYDKSVKYIDNTFKVLLILQYVSPDSITVLKTDDINIGLQRISDQGADVVEELTEEDE